MGRNTARVAAPVALLVFLGLSFVGAAAATDRVLPPETSGLVRRALAGLDGFDAQVASVRVGPARVSLDLCVGATCHAVVLGDPRAGCAGTEVGAWCLESTGALAEAPRAALIRALAASADPWRDAPGYTGEAPPEAAAAERSHQDDDAGWGAAAWPLALGLTFLPLLLGRWAGHRVRRRVPRVLPRRAVVIVAGPLVGCGAVLGLAAIAALSPWDGLWCAGWGGVGFATIAWPETWARAPRAAWIIAAVATLVGFGAAEGVVRGCMDAPQALTSADRARFVWSPEALAPGCRALYPAMYQPLAVAFADPARLAAAERVVLHVGDSMVEGSGLDPERELPFPDLLNAESDGAYHVNLGVGSVGPDYYVALLERWLATERRPDAVVVHLFSGNDATDVDRPYACCGGDRLLDAAGALRCPEPAWSFPLSERLAHAPTPYPLRVLGTVSAFARLLDHELNVAARAIFGRQEQGGEGTAGSPEQWARLELFLGRLRHTLEGIPALVSVLPYRQALEAAAPETTIGYDVSRRLVAASREAGLSAVDAWPLLVALLAEAPSSSWFAAEIPGDVHFGQAGHERYAAWLLAQMRDHGL